MSQPDSIKRLIEHISSLPGIGQKTASKLAFSLLKKSETDIKNFANSMMVAKQSIKNCSLCNQISDRDLCSICSSQTRDKTIICVVSDSQDIPALEKAHQFQGVYHVLGGLLEPTEGITADKLNIKKLLEKAANKNTKEIILALNPTIEGETTSLYLIKILKKYPHIQLSKLARGLPQGSDLEYADEVTLANALLGRTKI